MEHIHFSHRQLDSGDSWETILYETGQDAFASKVINALYLKDVVDVVNQYEDKLVINDDTVLWHATPSEHVRKNVICYMSVKQPFQYFRKKIKHAFLFGAQTYDDHLTLLKTITRFTLEASINPELYHPRKMRAWLKEHADADKTT